MMIWFEGFIVRRVRNVGMCIGCILARLMRCVNANELKDLGNSRREMTEGQAKMMIT